MRSAVCCVFSCKNNSFNSDVKFYKFPISKYKTEQRARWISAVRKINDSGDISWYPKTTSLICSAHFVGNKKSEEVMSPSYVPTKFSGTSNNKNISEICAINRHERFMRRRFYSTNKQKYNCNHTVEIAASNDYSDNIVNDIESMENLESLNHRKVDQACQVNIIFRDSISEPTKSFTCNRYSFKEESSDAEVQTDIYEGDIVVIPRQKMNKSKKCGTAHKEFMDASVGPDSEFSQCKSDIKNYFGGYASIKNDEQLFFTL